MTKKNRSNASQNVPDVAGALLMDLTISCVPTLHLLLSVGDVVIRFIHFQSMFLDEIPSSLYLLRLCATVLGGTTEVQVIRPISCCSLQFGEFGAKI